MVKQDENNMRQILVILGGVILSIISFISVILLLSSHRTDPLSALVGMVIVLCGWGAYHFLSELPMKPCSFCLKQIPHDMYKCEYCDEIQKDD
jgi:hypothetical protein